MRRVLPVLIAVLLGAGPACAAEAVQGRVGDIEIPRYRLRFGAPDEIHFDEPPGKIDFIKIPALITALNGKDDKARQEAAGILGFTGSKGKVAIPALVEMLKDPKPENRAVAANALGNLGPVAREAVPALVQALDDKEDVVVWGVLYAFIQIGPDARQAIPALLDGMHRFGVGGCKTLGVSGLGALEAMGSEAFPAVIKGLQDPKMRRRAGAAWALGLSYKFRQSPRIKEVLPVLIKLTRDENAQIRADAVFALGELHLDPEKTVPALIEALKEKGELVPERAALALSSFGTDAWPAVPYLLNKLNDPHREVRDSSAWALGEIRPSRDAVPVLIRKLDDRLSRFGAIRVLGRMGSDAQAAVPSLLRLLHDESGRVRELSAFALAEIVPGKEVLPVLVEALNDRWARTGVIIALGRMGREAKGAVPALVRLLRDPSEEIRSHARAALKRIGP